MKKTLGIAICIFSLTAGVAHAQLEEAVTPTPLVEAYDSLADAILAAKKTEWNLVHSILATTYSHAEAVMAEAKGKLEAGKDAKADIETLAALVAQIGNEGDASVAAVRKRLLEGGHHHHSNAEDQGVYDEGFVIVSRAAKKAFLDAAGRIGKLGRSAGPGDLDREWQAVEQEFRKLHPGTRKGG
jgi:hypothetical protein